jgi:hypothetical protein
VPIGSVNDGTLYLLFISPAGIETFMLFPF